MGRVFNAFNLSLKVLIPSKFTSFSGLDPGLEMRVSWIAQPALPTMRALNSESKKDISYIYQWQKLYLFLFGEPNFHLHHLGYPTVTYIVEWVRVYLG